MRNPIIHRLKTLTDFYHSEIIEKYIAPIAVMGFAQVITVKETSGNINSIVQNMEHKELSSLKTIGYTLKRLQR